MSRSTRIIARAAVAVLLALCAVVALWCVLVFAYRAIDPPASTLMLAQRLTGTPVNRIWVPLERVSPHLIKAVILAEDGQFCRHRGVDWAAIDEALDKAGDGGKPRGASTIAMQTVKNLFLWPQQHYVRKALEIPLAYAADRWWGKARMLEIYLNIAEWGPGVFGIEAAARHHFRRAAADLSPRESALLAVALPNPIDRNPGRPGPGTRRLAANLEARVARASVQLGCLQASP